MTSRLLALDVSLIDPVLEASAVVRVEDKTMPETNSVYFWWVIVLVLSALALTMYVFRQRMVERGDKKGVAANPRKVRRENPPDKL